eukprot:6520268-Prymnesium_polylepis.2
MGVREGEWQRTRAQHARGLSTRMGSLGTRDRADPTSRSRYGAAIRVGTTTWFECARCSQRFNTLSARSVIVAVVQIEYGEWQAVHDGRRVGAAIHKVQQERHKGAGIQIDHPVCRTGVKP